MKIHAIDPNAGRGGGLCPLTKPRDRPVSAKCCVLARPESGKDVATSFSRKFSPILHLLSKKSDKALGHRFELCHKCDASGEMKVTKLLESSVIRATGQAQ
jgi:hypothetical protein